MNTIVEYIQKEIKKHERKSREYEDMIHRNERMEENETKTFDKKKIKYLRLAFLSFSLGAIAALLLSTSFVWLGLGIGTFISLGGPIYSFLKLQKEQDHFDVFKKETCLRKAQLQLKNTNEKKKIRALKYLQGIQQESCEDQEILSMLQDFCLDKEYRQGSSSQMSALYAMAQKKIEASNPDTPKMLCKIPNTKKE